MADVYPSESRPRRRRGRRLLITLIVLLVLVGVGLVVLDRVAVAFAEREIGNRVAQEISSRQASAATPEVTIDGVPFLTQVTAGRYEEITILLRDFSAPTGDGRTIRMPLLDIRAKGVRAPLETLRTRQGDIVATTVTGTSTLDYAQLVALVGQEGLKLGERNGQLVATAPLEAVGQTFTVNGTAKLTIRGDVVQIRFDDVTAEGLPPVPLLQNLVTAYAKRLSVDVKLPPLPLDLQVRSVQPRPEGIVVTAGADEVVLNTAAS